MGTAGVLAGPRARWDVGEAAGGCVKTEGGLAPTVPFDALSAAGGVRQGWETSGSKGLADLRRA